MDIFASPTAVKIIIFLSVAVTAETFPALMTGKKAVCGTLVTLTLSFFPYELFLKNEEMYPYIIFSVLLISAAECLLLIILLILVQKIKMSNRAVFEKKEIEKEYVGYSRTYNSLLKQIGDILASGGSIEYNRDAPETAIAYFPDGKISVIRFDGNAEDWFIDRRPENNLNKLSAVRYMLAGPDVMIIRKGRYKEEAAERIIARTKEKCEKIRKEFSSPDIWMKDRTAVYVSKNGKVKKTSFDLPADILFPNVSTSKDGAIWVYYDDPWDEGIFPHAASPGQLTEALSTEGEQTEGEKG